MMGISLSSSGVLLVRVEGVSFRPVVIYQASGSLPLELMSINQ